jgi:hypothetical protein
LHPVFIGIIHCIFQCLSLWNCLIAFIFMIISRKRIFLGRIEIQHDSICSQFSNNDHSLCITYFLRRCKYRPIHHATEILLHDLDQKSSQEGLLTHWNQQK